MDSTKVRRHYLRGWFALDAVSSVPVEILTRILLGPAPASDGSPAVSLGGQGRWVKGLRMLKILRLLRLIQLKSVALLTKTWPNATRSLKLLLSCCFLAHFVACGYWALAFRVCVVRAAPAAAALCPAPLTLVGADDPAASCVFAPSLDAHVLSAAEDSLCPRHPSDLVFGTLSTTYVQAMYWGLVVIVGHPNETRQRTVAGTVFSGAVLILGLSVFGGIVGSVAAFLSTHTAARAERKAHTEALDRLMGYKRVPAGLKATIISYYNYLWDTCQMPVHRELLHKLPDEYAVPLEYWFKRKLIENCPLFTSCSVVALQAVIRKLRPCVTIPAEVIVHQGDVGDRMFFVIKGKLSVMVTQQVRRPLIPLRLKRFA
jgi:hypothetical protein